jgi:hypothetical protein
MSKNPPELYQTIRQLANDPQGRIWSDEKLDLFIDEAGNMLPRLTVSLMAMSRGAYEVAERFSAWPGLPHYEGDMLKRTRIKSLIEEIRRLVSGAELTAEEGDAAIEEIRKVIRQPK